MTRAKQGAIAPTRERDCLFDNIRCLLIFSVVLGHLLECSLKGDAVQLVYRNIYACHMVAFVFISGYFSKNVEKCRETAFRRLFLPFFFLNLIAIAIDFFQDGDRWQEIQFFQPRFGLWFLLGLFVWRFCLKDILRFRFALPLAFALGLVSGLFDEFGSYLAMGRILAFFPFFLLGFYTSSHWIEKIRSISKFFGALALSLAVAFTVCAYYFDWFDRSAYYMRRSYALEKVPVLEGLFWRAAIYLCALLFVFALLNLTPRVRGYWSKIGGRTMPVYVLHLFLIPFLKEFSFYREWNSWIFLAAAFGSALVITLVFSSKPVAFLYGKFERIPEFLLLKREAKQTR